MDHITPGFYVVNAFNLGEVLLNFKVFERRENVVHYPKIFRYKKKQAQHIQFYLNELGSGVSFQRIPDAANIEEAKRIYNDHNFYYATYNKLIKTINKTFGKKITDTDISFILEISTEKKESEYAQIVIHHNEHFTFFTAVFVQSMFIMELCWLMERRLISLLLQKRSYYSERILAEFASNLFIIENPEGYLPNYHEFEYMKELYIAWGIPGKVNTLKSKFELALTNYKFSLEYDEKRQNILTTMLLGSITIFSVNQTLPVIYDAFPQLKNNLIFNKQNVLLFFSCIALYVAFYTFARYFLAEQSDKLLFRFRQLILKRKIK